jgi:hypothetical protein
VGQMAHGPENPIDVYEEEFIIKWQQVVRPCLNIKKSFKKSYQTKIKVQMNVLFW